MSRQIVLDLRHCERIGIEPGKLLEDAADRIEQLEAALREIEYLDSPLVRGKPRRVEIYDIARAALGEKKDG